MILYFARLLLTDFLGSENMTTRKIRRRQFIEQAAATAAVATLPSSRVLGANDRVRLGIIGAGARGQELMKEFQKVERAEFVAAADVYTRRHDEAKELAPGIQTFTDYRRLLDLKEIDAVIVATPLHCHTVHFLAALAAGKDLYCEKTMTWSIEEAESCLAAAKRSKNVIAIGLQHQSSGELADVIQWIKDGIAGKVTRVESWMSRNTPRDGPKWLRPIPGDCNASNIDWKTFLNGRRMRPFDGHRFINWRFFWEFSGGNVTEEMVHQIAFIMRALDLPLPVAASMAGCVSADRDGREVPDTIAVTFDFPNDLVVTWQSIFSNSRFSACDRIFCSNGTIIRLMGSTDGVTGRSSSGIRCFPEEITGAGGAQIKGRQKGQNHFANFIECIRSRKEPNAPVEIGYRSAIAAHMANQSYHRRERVTLEEVTANRMCTIERTPVA
jgi:predicted dehydrogenase